MKKITKILALIMVLTLVFGVFSITAGAGSGYGIMVLANNKFTKQISSVTLYGRYDYLNLAIDCQSNNTYFGLGIFKDKNYEKLVWEDAVQCNAGSYTYTPYLPLKDVKSGTYYAMTFAAKIGSDGSIEIDENSIVEFKVKIDRTTAFNKQMVILKSSKNTVNGPEIKWCKLSGATSYKVYRRNHDKSKWTCVGTTSKTSFVDKKVKNTSGAYIYTVRGVNKNGTLTRYQYEALQTPVVGTPKISSVKSSGNDNVIKWNAIPKVKTYIVYRKAEGGSYKQIGRVTNGSTTFTDKTAKASNTKYIYTVRAERKLWGENIKSSYYSSGKSIKFIEAPIVNVVKTVADNAVHIEWSSVKDAVYTVYRKADGGSWEILEKNFTSTSYDDKTAKENGISYAYTVRANIGSERGHYVSSEFNKFFEAPELIGINVADNTVEISWKPVEAEEVYYNIFAKYNGESEWREIGSVSQEYTTYRESVENGTREYTIQAVISSSYASSYKGTGVKYANIPDVEPAIADTTGEKAVTIEWYDPFKSDSNTFSVYRKTTDTEWECVAEALTGEAFTDTNVEYNVPYEYAVVMEIGGVEAQINDDFVKRVTLFEPETV